MSGAFDQLVSALSRGVRRPGGRPRGVTHRTRPLGESLLADRRLALGVSQPDLAEMAGVDRATVRRAEAGRRLRDSSYLRIAAALRAAEAVAS